MTKYGNLHNELKLRLVFIFTFSEEQIVGEYGLYYDSTRRTREDEDEDEEEEHPDIRHTAPQHRQYLGQYGNM